MSSTVDQIKERLHIVDVVSSYIKLDKAGTNYKGKCPFHNEKTPSFFVSPDRDSFYCFGCGAKGDIFSFVEQFEGVDFRGALTMLADRAGVKITNNFSDKSDNKDVLYEVMEKATAFYEKNIVGQKSALEYLTKRGLTPKTIREWRIGFAPNEWKSVLTDLQAKKVRIEDIQKVGLIKPSEKNPRDFYDRFRSRIMFPLFDTSGRAIAFSGRIFGEVDDGKSAKYINSPETALFDKSKTLYGYHLAKRRIREVDYSLLVEGQMDLLLSHQAGFTNAVASSGTALTTGHLEQLRRLSNRLMVAYDADKAGVAASERAWQTALSLGMDVKVAALPTGKDPADLILENIEAWKMALRGATHIIDFYLNNLVAQKLDTRMLGREVEKKVLPYVAAIASNIEKSHFITKITSATGIREDALRAEVVKIEQTLLSPIVRAGQAEKPTQIFVLRKDLVERKITALLMWLEDKPERAEMKNVVETKIKAGIDGDYYTKLREHYAPQKNELLFETEATYGEIPSKADIDELVRNFNEEYLKERFVEAMKSLQEAERTKDNARASALLEECQKLSKQIQQLSP